MNSITIPIPLPAGGSDRGMTTIPRLTLAKVVYARAFYPPAFIELSYDDAKARVIALTWETNGYLLWVMVKAGKEPEWCWERESVTYLPPGGEDAIESAVALAQEWRSRYEALAAQAGVEVSS